jgi:electron transport complex protein RnfB
VTELIPLIDAIDALLPQTQCTKCGYQGCRPYAEAIAAGDAINKCPPGGQAGIAKLAQLLDRPAIPLDTSHGEEPTELKVAFIREEECIGCTKCIQACPVDAILGAAKLMHTIASDICTGCDLCVAPCPVDCIDMVPAAEQQPSAAAVQLKADLSRARFQRRNARLQQQADARAARKQARIEFHEQTENASSETRNAAVLAALAAVREKAAQQSVAEQRAKLEKTLAAAQERLARAEAKVREAEQRQPDQLSVLLARREDMRFKVEETRKKLAALDTASPAASTGAARNAVERMLAARSRKTDRQRLDEALATLDGKLAALQQQLAIAEGEEAIFLREDIERLQRKREQLLAE